MKNRGGPIASEGPGAACAVVSLASGLVLLLPESEWSLFEGCVTCAGETGEELLRSRHTSLLPWNLESWNRVTATTQELCVL